RDAGTQRPGFLIARLAPSGMTIPLFRHPCATQGPKQRHPQTDTTSSPRAPRLCHHRRVARGGDVKKHWRSVAGFAAAAVLGAAPALAQTSWPTKPIRWTVA